LFYPGKMRGQASVATLVNLRAAGIPPLDVIRAITVNEAEMLAGWTASARSSPRNLLICPILPKSIAFWHSFATVRRITDVDIFISHSRIRS
jgi:hypothetical protein